MNDKIVSDSRPQTMYYLPHKLTELEYGLKANRARKKGKHNVSYYEIMQYIPTKSKRVRDIETK